MNRLKTILADEKKAALILIGLKILLFAGTSVKWETDSAGYVFLNVFSSESWPDLFRTPGYPALFSVFMGLLGQNAGIQAVTLLQLAFSCGAALCFGRTVAQLTGSKRWGFAALYVYGLSFPIISWENILFTESLSLSLTVFYIFLLLSFLKQPGLSKLVLLFALVSAMTWIRPSSLSYFFITWVFALCFSIVHKHLRVLAATTVLLVLCLIPVSLYTKAFEERFGLASLSVTLTSQQTANILTAGIAQQMPDSQIAQALLEEWESSEYAGDRTEQALMSALTVGEALGEKGYGMLNRFNQEAIRQFPAAFLADRIREGLAAFSLPYGRMPDLSFALWKLPSFALWGLSYLTFAFCTFGVGFQIGCAAMFVFFYRWIFRRSFDFVWAGIWSCIWAPMVISVFGTCADYARTAITAVPFIYLGIFLAAHMLFVHLNRRRSSPAPADVP